MPKRKYKAIIQTSLTTGVHRVFILKKINDSLKIVEKTKPTGSYRVTGYTKLAQLSKVLKNAIPVYIDEQILWNGQNCEVSLYKTGEEEVA